LCLEFVDALKDFSLFEQAAGIDFGCSARFTCSYSAITCSIVGMTVSWVEIGLKEADEDCASKCFVPGVFECGHGLI